MHFEELYRVEHGLVDTSCMGELFPCSTYLFFFCAGRAQLAYQTLVDRFKKLGYEASLACERGNSYPQRNLFSIFNDTVEPVLIGHQQGMAS